MKKKLISSILCSTMLFSLGTTTIYAQDDVLTNEGTETNTISETTEVIETETNEPTLPESTVKAGTPIEGDQTTQPEEVAYYDPEVNKDVEFTFDISYDKTKTYTAGDIIDLTITIKTNSETPYKFKDAYLWHSNPNDKNGNVVDLSKDLILSSEASSQTTVKYQVPWDKESNSLNFYCSLQLKDYGLAIGSSQLSIPVTPITPIIENGVYKFENENAPERYLITLKYGEGVTGSSIIYGGSGDAREVLNEATLETDYYLRPGYPSSFWINVKEEYLERAEDGNMLGLKDGYSFEFKVTNGDGTVIYDEQAPFIVNFDLNKPTTIEVQIKDNNAPEKTTTIENTSGVTMTLPEKEASGLTLQVTTSDGKAEQTAINKVVQVEGDKIKTFDLTLLKDGVPFEYNGQFTSTVSLPIPEGWNMDQLALYYFNEETNETTPVEFTVDKTNSTIIFNTNHFSKYVLVEKAVTTTTETKKETTKTKSVKTGVETNMTSNVMLWSNIALAAILGGLMLRKKPE